MTTPRMPWSRPRPMPSVPPDVEAPLEGSLPAADEAVLPSEPDAPKESLPPAAAPPAPAPVHPEAERGVSDGTAVCTVCLRPVAGGEVYARTAVRGINHLEPCSHRA